MIHDQLKDFGLTESEIKIYINLITEGHASPPRLSKLSGIAKTNLYPILDSLKRRGLINEQPKGKRKIYLTKDPMALVQQLERRKQMMEDLVPQLRLMSGAGQNKPKIQIFETTEEIKELFISMLNCEEKTIYGVASTKRLFDVIGYDFFRWWQKKLKSLKITIYDILTAESLQGAAKQATSNAQEFYRFVGIPKSFGDIGADILLWDDKIVLINLDKPVYATLIQSKAIALTMLMMFKQTWESFKG